MKSGKGRAPRICRRDIRLKDVGLTQNAWSKGRWLGMVLVKDLGIRKL